MKIICLTRSLTVGGAERQMAGLAVMLHQAGHQVEVLTYHPQDFYAATLKENGVRHCCILKKNDRQILRDLAGHIREEAPDVVIAFLVGPSLKACRIHRMWPHFKLVVSERNVNQSFLPHDAYRFLVFREADRVIANSHAQEAFVRRHAPWLRGKLGTIVNFTDTDRFRPAGSKPENVRKVICTTARVDRRKNVHGYIKAAGILKARGYDFEMRWYGLTKKDRYWKKCTDIIKAAGLADCFFILDASREVDRIYNASDIFCLPSFYEGTPNSMCEAISSGLPVACSDVSDNALYVRSGINGETFDPKSPEDIAQALALLLDKTDDQLAVYGRNSRDTALEAFSKKRFIENYLSMISAILDASVR